MQRIISKLVLFAVILFTITAEAQVTLAHTNAAALQWNYPAAAVTPDLGFQISSITNLGSTNWQVLTNFSSTNQVSWGGTNYPAVSGSSEIFTLPLVIAGQAQYFTIASYNLTGISLPMVSTNYPGVVPLEWIGNFLIVNHP